MLNHPTLDRLRELGLDGMAKGFRDLAANPESRALEHAEWLGLLVGQEITLRQQKRFEARTRTAKLRQAATAEDVDFRKPRGLDRTLFLHLASCDWVREHRHCLITGPCGTGKSFIACALGDRLAGTTCPSSTSAARGCSARWRWRVATAVTPV